VGNIFKLGTKYSVPFDLRFKDKDGVEKPVIMDVTELGLAGEWELLWRPITTKEELCGQKK